MTRHGAGHMPTAVVSLIVAMVDHPQGQARSCGITPPHIDLVETPCKRPLPPAPVERHSRHTGRGNAPASPAPRRFGFGPIPGAPGCLPGLRAGWASAGWASAGVVSSGFASPSPTAAMASASASASGAPPFRSHGARLLGGRELFAGPRVQRYPRLLEYPPATATTDPAAPPGPRTGGRRRRSAGGYGDSGAWRSIRKMGYSFPHPSHEGKSAVTWRGTERLL